jgi:hypothetical protein
VTLAHTADEYVVVTDLEEAVDRYVFVARHLLERPPAPAA